MKKHILFIDDEAEIRELLGEILTMRGYRLTAVGTSENAKRIVKEDPRPDHFRFPNGGHGRLCPD